MEPLPRVIELPSNEKVRVSGPFRRPAPLPEGVANRGPEVDPAIIIYTIEGIQKYVSETPEGYVITFQTKNGVEMTFLADEMVFNGHSAIDFDEKEVKIRNFDGSKFFTKANQFVEDFIFQLENLAVVDEKKELDYMIRHISDKHKIDNYDTISLFKKIYIENKVLKLQKLAFIIFHEGYKTNFDKYMEQLFTLIKFINKSSNKIKKLDLETYILLLKSQLSSFEIKNKMTFNAF